MIKPVTRQHPIADSTNDETQARPTLSFPKTSDFGGWGPRIRY